MIGSWLAGPRFLAAYAILALVVVAGAWAWLRFKGALAVPKVSDLAADPYSIACLRKGERETIRLAVFNLVDRGLLSAQDELVVTPRADAVTLVRRPLDRAILKSCAGAVPVDKVLTDRGVVGEAWRYRVQLTNKGLLHPRSVVWTVVLAGCALLAGVGLARIVAALAQGRSFGYLAMLTIAACVAFAAAVVGAHTRSGGAALADLRAMTRRLKERAQRLRPGGATNEALLLASVHGLAVLPAEHFPFVEDLFPRPKLRIENDGDGDGGSGCGGGGGCGGCGGCGG